MFAGLVIVATVVVAYDPITKEFAKAAKSNVYKDSTLLVPVDCRMARGSEGKDYNKEEDGPWRQYRADKSLRLCWYEEPKFRALCPEYNDFSTDDLTERLYTKAGLSIERARPWKLVAEFSAFMIGLPLGVLAAGATLYWALSGFKRGTSAPAQ